MTNHGDTAGELRLSGPLTIRRAAELRDMLMASLANHQTTTLDLPDDADVDISFIQLVQAARVSARASGKEIRLKQASAGVLKDVLGRGGFLSGDAAQFWTMEGGSQ